MFRPKLFVAGKQSWSGGFECQCVKFRDNMKGMSAKCRFPLGNTCLYCFSVRNLMDFSF